MKKSGVTLSILIIIIILLITSLVLPNYFNKIELNNTKEIKNDDNNKEKFTKEVIDEKIIEEEILNVVKKVPFSRENNNSKDLIDLRLIYDAFLNIDKEVIDISEKTKSEYFNLKKDDFSEEVYNVITKLSFTAFEIEKLHPLLWSDMADGNTLYYVIDGNIIREEIAKNNKFYDFKLNKSKVYPVDLINDDETSRSGYILYEKDIDKFIIHVDMEPTGTTRNVLVLNSNKEDNIYKVEFVEAIYKWFTMPITVINKDNIGNITDIVCDREEDLDMKLSEYTNIHKDELSKYEIEFEINNGKYEFKNINKIN